MTVRELIEALQKMPPDAEVYFLDGPWQDCVYAEEQKPSPQVQDDGRVCL